MNINTFPIISLIRRKILLIILTAASLWASANDQLFDLVGSWLYLFPLALGAALVTFVVREVTMRNLSKHADPKDDDACDFHSDWKDMDPASRVFASLLTTCLIFIGICIIAAQLWVAIGSSPAPAP